jgi:hypothetical protein
MMTAQAFFFLQPMQPVRYLPAVKKQRAEQLANTVNIDHVNTVVNQLSN